MKLKLGLIGNGNATIDVVVTVDPGATVAELAGALDRRNPNGPAIQAPQAVTLARWAPNQELRSIPADLTLTEAGLRSGGSVRIVADRGTHAAGANAPKVATVRILAGPDAGQEFEVPEGTSYIGRDSQCDIHLTDPMVSKQHAKLHVTTVAELVDTNSSNGVVVAGEPVPRVVLRPDDTAVLGDTTIAVAMHRAGNPDAEQGNIIPFNRSPLISPYFDGREFEAPELPQQLQAQRLPIIPLFTPLIMGVMMYIITKNTLSILMVGMSPLMMVGNFYEGRRSRRRAFAQALAEFHEALADLDGEMGRSAAEEHATRLGENPPTNELAEAIDGLRPLTWTRRPNGPGFLEVRLGLGIRPSRSTLKLPSNAKQRSPGFGELVALEGKYAEVIGVPVVADLKAKGALGISGDDDLARDIARGVIAQIVGLHSPAEVVLAGVASAATAINWDWIKWTPHVTSPHSPLQSPQLAVGQGACLNLVAEIEALIDERAGRKDGEGVDDVCVVLLVEDDAAIERSRLVAIAERGAAHNVMVVWCAPSTEQLPAACRTYLEANRSAGTVGAVYVDNREPVALSDVERIDVAAALRIALRISPVVDVGAGVDDSGDLPGSVSFLALADPELATSPDAVLERWIESSSIVDRRPDAPRRRIKESSLRAVIGRTATDTLHVDLRANGPHALVGGTTGAGKSELLQSWIMGMAAAYSPDRVTFLLVDYKGGSAFGDCSQLPHTVGMVTDLSLHLAQRALTSLVAELRFREHVLSRKRAKDLIELERTGDPETPPSLIIVIDEFAALVQELPEFVDGVVNVAQRGRSLGLHLILATQRPAGVIKDNLRANTNLRIALRMADEGDSTDVLGSPIAASFDPAVPGRASAKFGPGRLVGFQAAYVGGRTLDTTPPLPIDIEELVFGSAFHWEEPQAVEVTPEETSGPSDIRRLVETIGLAAKNGGIPRPRLPWLSELAPVYELRKLPTARKDTELIFGVCDDPKNQAQPLGAFYPDRAGNLVIFGTSGSGKSTALRSLAVASAFTVRGGPCHVYGLDFASRGLSALEELPHVGSIIDGEDIELVGRLLRMLRDTIDDRAKRYAEVKAATITEYRSLASAPGEARILLLVDGLGSLRQAYEASDRTKLYDLFVSIVQGGRPLGVHIIGTADRPGALPVAVASTMQQRLIMRLANENDMLALGVPKGGFDGDVPPGRGFLDGLEMQVAVLGGSTNVSEQAVAIMKLAAALRRNQVAEAPAMRRLEDRVFLGSLPTSINGLPVIGVVEETLEPATFVPKGGFLISGPPGSGRTTSLATMALALRRWRPDGVLVYLGSSGVTLSGLAEWSTAATGPEAVADKAKELAASLNGGELGDRPVAVIIDGLAELSVPPVDSALLELVKPLIAAGHLVVAEGDPSTLAGASMLLQALKISRYGFALQPDQLEGTSVYKTAFPRVTRGQFPIGRGLLVAGGRTAIVQIGLPE